MDPKSARELIDAVCEEIDAQRQDQPRFAALLKQARTLGLGIALGLAATGCGDDDAKLPGPDAAYGVPDGYLNQERLPGPDAAYGVPDFLNVHDVATEMASVDGGVADGPQTDAELTDGPPADGDPSSDAQ